MRYLNKIIFLNSAHIPYAEVGLDGNVHFIGTQGVGKSTVLRAILFFYNADKLKLGIPKEKQSFDTFYFPYTNSYIVYEVMRENGAYCVVAMKSQGRVMFRFVNAPYCNQWFIDEQRQVLGGWMQIRERVGRNTEISSLVSSYETFRDIVFGNNRRQEMLAFRKYAIVESSKYQNIPRTIQNIFLNTKLDADFIKNTIIQSMSDENSFIDLTFYREQIKEFEQEYKDVCLWTEKTKGGKIIIRLLADKVIDSYRTLLNTRRLIGEERKEMNYAERVAREIKPQYLADIQQSEQEYNRFVRLRNEEQEKYDKERSRLDREIGVLEDKLKNTVTKRRRYEEMHIMDILRKVEQEPVLEEELRRQEMMKATLEKSCQNVVDRYKTLIDQTDMDFRTFETNQNMLLSEHKEAAMAKKEMLMMNLRKAEEDIRGMIQQKIDSLNEVIAQLRSEEMSLSVQKTKIGQENPFLKEMDICERNYNEYVVRKAQIESEIKEKERHISSLRKEAEYVLESMELKFQSSLVEPRKQKEMVEEEIGKLQSLLLKSKGSFAEWLDHNKTGWQETIGKVADEDCILYNDALTPQLVSSSEHTFFGVSINLDAVESTFRSPEELKALSSEKERERTVCVRHLDELQEQCEENKKSVAVKYQQQIRKANDDLRVLRAELTQMPQLEKKLRMQTLELKNRLDDWRKEQWAILDDKQNAILAERSKKEDGCRQLVAELQRRIRTLQAEYNKQTKMEDDTFDVFSREIKQQIAEKKRQTDLCKEELKEAQYGELHKKGMDTAALDIYDRYIASLTSELDYVRKHRNDVIAYYNDQKEYFDREPSVRQELKNKIEALSLLKMKFQQRRERLASQMATLQERMDKQKVDLKMLEDGIESVKNFRNNDTLCPIGCHEVAEKTSTRNCCAIVESLKCRIYEEGKQLDSFKKQAQQFLGYFSARNIFHFNVGPVTEEEFFSFASNLCEFVENDKISEYQKRISGRYTDIILRIAKEVGDLTRREGEVTRIINDINRDFEERNFAGVIREITLRSQKTNDQLMLLLSRIKDFSDDNQYNMGEMDLFSTDTQKDVNTKAVKYLFAFMKALWDNPNRKRLLVSDTFRLEFRIKENDNDTGWVEKITNVGSDGTDILVKAMVNIMLINVFKEKASKMSGDFKIHCMMDEIGKLHPNNVRGILDFANRRNILLVNSSPTTYNVEDYKYTYLLSKDDRARTKVIQLIKRL